MSAINQSSHGLLRPLITTAEALAVVAGCIIGTTQSAWSQSQALTASIVGDLQPGATGSEPQELLNVAGVLYFTADDGTHGRELWKSDPRTGDTKMIADISPGAASSSPGGLVNFQDQLYFAATTATAGRELWVYRPQRTRW